MRTRRTSLFILVLIWCALTLGSGLANWYAWGSPDPATGRTGPLDVLCKDLANASQAVNAPFWFVAWFGLQRYTSFGAAVVVNGIGFAFWMGVAALVLELRKRWRRAARPKRTAEEIPVPSGALTRRAFIADSALVTGVACAGAAGVYASFVTPWSLKVVRYTIPIAGLPRGLDGFRMVQITDTHLGPRIPAAFITQAVDLAIALKPDMFLLTGDYVHMGTSYIDPAVELFRPLTERRAGLVGTLGVLGNHDYYADGPGMQAALERIGVRMLTNDRLFLDGVDRDLTPLPRRAAESVCIAGVDDLLEGRVELHRALRGAPEETPRIILSHNPDVAEAPELLATRADLMISGHTHGGQVRLPLIGSPAIPSHYGQKYAYGLIRGPACPVLVCAGVGMSLIPVRVGVRPEVLEITLRSA